MSDTDDPTMEHVPATDEERGEFEKKHGVWYCKRCGRLLRSDAKGVAVGASKPCRIVKVSLRSAGDPMTAPSEHPGEDVAPSTYVDAVVAVLRGAPPASMDADKIRAAIRERWPNAFPLGVFTDLLHGVASGGDAPEVTP